MRTPTVSRFLVYFGVAVIVLAPLTALYFDTARPVAPEAARRRVVARNVSHGDVRYLTPGEAAFFDALPLGGLCGFLLGAVGLGLAGKSNWRN